MDEPYQAFPVSSYMWVVAEKNNHFLGHLIRGSQGACEDFVAMMNREHRLRMLKGKREQNDTGKSEAD